MAGNELGQRKAILLAALVVVGTGGAIFVMGRDQEEAAVERQVEEAPEEKVLEVTPLLTPGAIRSASWHEGDEADGPGESALSARGEGESLLDRLSDDDADERFDKSLEKTVEPINGLGVYVKPPEKKGR